jgi:predicted Zn-dependent protease
MDKDSLLKRYLEQLFRARYQTPQQQLEVVRDIKRRGFLRQVFEIALYGAFASTCCAATNDYYKFLPDLGDPDRLNLSLTDATFIGKQVIYNIDSQGNMLEDYDLVYYLNSLGNNLVSFSAVAGIQTFNFYALKGNEVNAFALPGGFICIYNGLVYTTQSESELAGIISHEIGHIVQHHIFRNIAIYDRNQWLSIVGLITGALLATVNPSAAIAAASGGQGLAIQNILSFSRDFEREADRVGQGIMYNAGFDAHAMPTFFARLQNAEKFNSNNALAFLQTHPVTIERLSEAELRANQLPVKMLADSISYSMMREKCRVRQLGLANAINFYQQSLKTKRYARIDIVYYGYAYANVLSGSFNGALSNINLITDLTITKHPAYLSLKAITYGGLNKYKAALTVYEESLSNYPDYKGLWIGKVDLMMTVKQYKAAGQYIKTLLDKYPNDNDLWSRMAFIYSDSNLNDMLRYYYALGTQQFIIGNYRGALTNYQQALKNAGEKSGDFSDIISSKIIELQNIIRINARYGVN